MGSTITLDISAECAEVVMQPELKYVPASIAVNGKFGRLALHANDEQLAEIAESIRIYLDNKRHHEIPDQQLIYTHELEVSA